MKNLGPRGAYTSSTLESQQNQIHLLPGAPLCAAKASVLKATDETPIVCAMPMALVAQSVIPRAGEVATSLNGALGRCIALEHSDRMTEGVVTQPLADSWEDLWTEL